MACVCGHPYAEHKGTGQCEHPVCGCMVYEEAEPEQPNEDAGTER